MDALFKSALLQPLELTANAILKRDPHLIHALYQTAGEQALWLECTSTPGFGLGVLIRPQGINLLSQPPSDVAVTLRGSAAALTGLLYNPDASAALHHPELAITGDIHLIQRLHSTITRLELDWADLFSHPAWDIASELLKSGSRQVSSMASTLRLDTRDFLQHEAALLPARAEVSDLQQRTDSLRQRIDRLHARLALLRTQAHT